jgi:glycerol kinase
MILAIDQGTTGTTCMVFDQDGTPRGRAYSEFSQHFPQHGWVEHDATEIWEVTRRAARHAPEDAAIVGPDLAAIGITNQRETVVAWDARTGEPLHSAIVWQTAAPRAAATSFARPGTSPCSASARVWYSTRTSQARSTSGCSNKRPWTVGLASGRPTPGSSSS